MAGVGTGGTYIPRKSREEEALEINLEVCGFTFKTHKRVDTQGQAEWGLKAHPLPLPLQQSLQPCEEPGLSRIMSPERTSTQAQDTQPIPWGEK